MHLCALDSLWFPPLPPLQVAEPAPLQNATAWHWSERHLQCLWDDDKLRPKQLTTHTGLHVQVLSPGRWNLEAGPDFLDATIKVGRRIFHGDVEIHIRPGDWLAHHHQGDARYANVILHVTWFPTDSPCVPDHVFSVSLREPVSANSRFSFDAIDLAAYPHAILPNTPRPCALILAHASKAQIQSILENAGLSRLRRKSIRTSLRLQATGNRQQVFYEECMAALGYKPNAEAMRRLAHLAPLEHLASLPTFLARYATLLGLGGLLPDPNAVKRKTAESKESKESKETKESIESKKSKKSEELRNPARELWDIAWKLGVADAANKPDWKLGATRPANHPKNRLVAAAALFASPHAFLDALDAIPQSDPTNWFKMASQAILQILEKAESQVPDTWKKYLTIGEERRHTILTNVVIPLYLAENRLERSVCYELPYEAINEQVAATAFRLLGRDHNPALYAKHGLRIQGLMEICQGHCLCTKKQCADCLFAQALQKAFSESFSPDPT